MHMTRRPRTGPRGFTLIELLVVITIIALISAIALPTILPALSERRVSESARVLQAILAGTRDTAIRANAPRGFRLLPDPIFNGLNGNPLASNRIIPIEPGPDYTEGLVCAVVPNNTYFINDHNYSTLLSYNNLANVGTGGNYLIIAESDFSGTASNPVPNNPTSWSQNIRQGDKLRFNDSGAYYTIAGPVNGPPFGLPNTSATTFGTGVPTNPYVYNNERLISCSPSSPGTPLANAVGWVPEFLFLMNGQDDNGNGWIDEGCDGIDNDGDGIVDPGFNGIDDSGYINGIPYGKNGIIDEPAEMMIGTNAGEFEQEVFIGAQATMAPVNQAYTIFRRPVVSPGAREVTLPEGIVIDLSTWSAAAASLAGKSVLLPERSRLPVDAYTGNVDIMIDQTGRVIPPGAGMDGGGAYANSPLASLPFYHFWLTEREGVVPPLFNPPGYTSAIPVPNPNYVLNGSAPNNMLPMPSGYGYTPPSGATTPFLTGERRLVTLFIKTGQIVSNSILNFNANDTNAPFYDAQAGIKEPQ